MGPHRLRSGWRALIFLVLALGVTEGAVHVLHAFGIIARQDTMTPGFAALGETVLLISVLFATAVMAFFEHRGVGSYGLGLRPGFLRRFSIGAVWGIVPLSVLLLLLRALHVLDFSGSDLTGTALLRAGLLFAWTFLLTGIAEQSAMRGYPLYALARSIGFWPAAVITSLLFALIHISNSGEAIAGIMGVFVVGMIFCLMLRRTGDLWFAIGNHFAWDYGETFLFGVPNSGTPAQGHLLTAHTHGSHWLSGGSVGPEGSLLVFVVLGLLALAFHYCYPQARSFPTAAVHSAPTSSA